MNRWLGTLEPETARKYGGVLRRLYERRDPLGAKESDLRDFVEGTASLGMRRLRVSALHSFYLFAVNRELLTLDPSRNISLRAMARPSNADLLRAIGANQRVSWVDLLHDATGPKRLRWGGAAGQETLRRILLALKRCQDARSLIRTLQRPVIGPAP